MTGPHALNAFGMTAQDLMNRERARRYLHLQAVYSSYCVSKKAWELGFMDTEQFEAKKAQTKHELDNLEHALAELEEGP